MHVRLPYILNYLDCLSSESGRHRSVDRYLPELRRGLSLSGALCFHDVVGYETRGYNQGAFQTKVCISNRSF